MIARATQPVPAPLASCSGAGPAKASVPRRSPHAAHQCASVRWHATHPCFAFGPAGTSVCRRSRAAARHSASLSKPVAHPRPITISCLPPSTGRPISGLVVSTSTACRTRRRHSGTDGGPAGIPHGLPCLSGTLRQPVGPPAPRTARPGLAARAMFPIRRRRQAPAGGVAAPFRPHLGTRLEARRRTHHGHDRLGGR